MIALGTSWFAQKSTKLLNKLVLPNQEMNTKEQYIKNLNTVNVGSTGEVMPLPIMNPDSSFGIYMIGLFWKRFRLVQEYREKYRTDKQSLIDKMPPPPPKKRFSSKNKIYIWSSIQYNKFLSRRQSFIIFVLPQINWRPQYFIYLPGRQHGQPQEQNREIIEKEIV